MPVCPKCSIQYEEGKKFCKHCGSPLVAEPTKPPQPPTRRCPTCNTKYEKNEKFCSQCGTPLTSKPKPPPPAPAPEAKTKESKPRSTRKREWHHIIAAVLLFLYALASVYGGLQLLHEEGFSDFSDDEVIIGWVLLAAAVVFLSCGILFLTRNVPKGVSITVLIILFILALLIFTVDY